MNELKYRMFNIFFFFLLLGSSYWAFQHIDTKVFYTADDVVKEETVRNDSPSSEHNTEVLETGGGDKFLVKEEEEENQQHVQKEEEIKKKNLSQENKELVQELEKLIHDKVYMKKGSRGTRVGVVQKFLNKYLEKETRVDNDYGPQTVERVKQFQKKEGLDPDGQAGPQTYAKMIEVLESGKLS